MTKQLTDKATRTLLSLPKPCSEVPAPTKTDLKRRFKLEWMRGKPVIKEIK